MREVIKAQFRFAPYPGRDDLPAIPNPMARPIPDIAVKTVLVSLISDLLSTHSLAPGHSGRTGRSSVFCHNPAATPSGIPARPTIASRAIGRLTTSMSAPTAMTTMP